MIEKYKPINAKPNSKAQKYRMTDNFLSFWFRFIYRNRSAVETGNFDYIRDVIKRDYSTYAGRALEQFYKVLFAETGKYNRIGSYWEKDHQNEIDLVAINDMKKELFIAEVKMNKDRVNLSVLKEKAKALVASYSKYEVQWHSLGLEDIDQFIQS